LLVDVEGWPAWTESMREIKRREDGPLVVGSRSRVTQPKGQPMVWTVPLAWLATPKAGARIRYYLESTVLKRSAEQA
jgi:hypothetical protein